MLNVLPKKTRRTAVLSVLVFVLATAAETAIFMLLLAIAVIRMSDSTPGTARSGDALLLTLLAAVVLIPVAGHLTIKVLTDDESHQEREPEQSPIWSLYDD